MTTQAAVAFSGQLTEREFRHGQDLMLRKVRMAFGAPLVVVVAVLLFAKYYPGGGKDPLVIAIVWAPLFVLLPLSLMLNRMLLRRYWRRNKLLGQAFSGTASETGMEWTTENNHSTLTWNGMSKVVNADAIVVLGAGSQSFWLPRSAFATDADWTLFRALVTSRLSS